MNRPIIALLLLVTAGLTAWAQDAVTVQFYTPSVVRIVKGGPAPAHSYAVTAQPQAVAVKTTAGKSGTTYASAALKVSVAPDGTVRFQDARGRILLKEGD